MGGADYLWKRIELTVPKFTGRRSEPLVSMGTAGQGDLVYITYESSTRISIGHDHWGYGGTISAPISIRPAEILIIEIDAPVMRASSLETETAGTVHRHLIVRVNGQPVLRETERIHATAPETIAIGRNPLLFTTAESSFSGTVHWISRLAEPLE